MSKKVYEGTIREDKIKLLSNIHTISKRFIGQRIIEDDYFETVNTELSDIFPAEFLDKKIRVTVEVLE